MVVVWPGSDPADVVEILEGIDLDCCSLSLEGPCSATGKCSVQRRLCVIEERYLKSLEELTIARLAKDIVVDTNL